MHVTKLANRWWQAMRPLPAPNAELCVPGASGRPPNFTVRGRAAPRVYSVPRKLEGSDNLVGRGNAMKLAVAICAFTLLAATSAGANETPEVAAQSAALAWLSLVDAGNYASQWQTAAASARAPLDALKSRTLQSATPKSALPGAPDGRYVVIEFAASFEHKASAIETVTPMMDADGKWHVSGYYIK